MIAKSPQRHEQHDILTAILDSLDALVYVSDMDTYELLYMNAWGRKIWGEIGERKCWQVFQHGLSSPCAFCTNNRLLDNEGKPTGPYVWEYYEPRNGHWYQCRDQAVRWIDGRMARLEIATDITAQKKVERDLKAASKRAEELAYTDELTGLYNRRAFFAFGNKAAYQAKRDHQPISLIMFDVDLFKRINDTYGHAMGDEVLTAISAAIQPQVRRNDIFSRIGGEEFAILMIGTSTPVATQLAERLRQAVEATIFPATPELHCTASFGVAGSSGQSLEKLLSRADRAMYCAKAAGRNRVIAAEQIDPHHELPLNKSQI